VRILKVALLLIPVALAAQRTAPTGTPAPRPYVYHPPVMRSSLPTVVGDVLVPITKAQQASHKIIWKHVVRPLPQNNFDSNRLIIWIQDNTHPGPTLTRNGEKDWLKYDPRNVNATRWFISFDAVAGDHIFYEVGQK
jgi:hypothetical protein